MVNDRRIDPHESPWIGLIEYYLMWDDRVYKASKCEDGDLRSEGFWLTVPLGQTPTGIDDDIPAA